MTLFHKTHAGRAAGGAEPDAQSRAGRGGLYSAGAAALAVAVVIIFNLLAAQIPASKAQIDLTGTKIYNITDVSVQYLSGISEDVAIHVLADRSSVDARIVRFLDRYVSLSDRLSLEYVDPAVYPSALSRYGVDAGSVVVTCAATGRQESFALDDVIGYDQMAYYMYQQKQETDFDAEGLLTSAVDGVLTAVRRAAYLTSGHGESALSQDVTDSLGKLHFSVGTVNLLTEGGIPEDCALLIVDAPVRDLADDELSMLRTYLAQGGQMILCLSSQLEALENLDALCADYGLRIVPGLVTDTQRYYQNTPFLFFPVADTSSDAAGALGADAAVLLYGARGMTVTEPVRDTITVTPFLTTGESGVAVDADNVQTSGSYVVGAAAEEPAENGQTARLTVFGCDSLCSDAVTASFPNVDNHALFLSAAAAGFDDASPISIQPVSLAEESNTVVTGGLWGLLFIFVIPAALLICGFARWAHRRKL